MLSRMWCCAFCSSFSFQQHSCAAILHRTNCNQLTFPLATTATPPLAVLPPVATISVHALLNSPLRDCRWRRHHTCPQAFAHTPTPSHTLNHMVLHNLTSMEEVVHILQPSKGTPQNYTALGRKVHCADNHHLDIWCDALGPKVSACQHLAYTQLTL